MGLLSLILHPHTILRVKTGNLTVKEVLSPEIQTLIRDMMETMISAKGVGLAAPQVGKPISLCLITHDGTDPFVLINPTIIKKSVWQEWGEEGCLSIPGVWGDVKRNSSVTVEYIDVKGEQHILEAKGFYARVCQHEIDHLDGILFIDKAKNIRETLSQ